MDYRYALTLVALIWGFTLGAAQDVQILAFRAIAATGHWDYTYTRYWHDTTWTTAGSRTWSTPDYGAGTTQDSVRIRLWGGGGAGSRITTNGRVGGGGAGAGYSEGVVTTPSGNYTVVTGVAGVSAATPTNGGASTFGTTTVVAPGGLSAGANSATGATYTAAGTGRIAYHGGSGQNGSSTNAGGGGEGADTAAHGNNAGAAPAGGTGTAGGDGGNGRSATQGVGLAGNLKGGAGGGAYRTSTTYAGGAGTAGQATLRWYWTGLTDSTWDDGFVRDIDTVEATEDDGSFDWGDESSTTQITYIGQDADELMRVAYRFQLWIPQGKTIDTATVYHWVAGNATATTDSLDVVVYDVDNVDAFADAHAHDIDVHATLSAVTVVVPTPVGTDFSRTVDGLASLVQVPISRGGWVSGNYIGIGITHHVGAWTSGHYYNGLDYSLGLAGQEKTWIRVVYH